MSNMLKGKFYTFLIGMFLMGTGYAMATSGHEFPIYKKSYYTAMKSEVSNYEMIGGTIDAYLEEPYDENTFQKCIGIYVCSDAAVREIMEKRLDGIGNINVIDTAKAVLAGKYGL
ncbi:MAG: hypothetical protein LBP39_03445 [Rickettsiales bacterium]|nr:hypothetical protein [Rickettsiales bacterium]